jgi:hypothetical protein
MEDQKTVFKRLKDIVDKSSYQKELHNATEGEDVLIRTHFLNMQRKETWAYKVSAAKLDCVGDVSNPNRITYKLRTLPYHGFLNNVVIQKFPSVKAKTGFEICYTPNLGSNIISQAELQVNDLVWQTLDSEYFDDHNSKICVDKNLDVNLGNVPQLTSWSKSLPSYTTLFSIPWFYTSHTSKMFPLYYCGKEDHIEHHLTLRRNLGELIRIRSIDTGEIIPFDEACIEVDSLTLSPPEMRGDYVFMSDMECEHNRCNAQKLRSEVFDIDNVRSIDSDNIYSLNNTVNIKIKDMPFPVHTIHWKASNVKAKSLNYHSNYTTNSENHNLGESPIKHTSLTCPQGVIFKNVESLISERIIPSNTFAKVPSAGYGCWTNAVSPIDPLYPKAGIKLDEGELSIRLEDASGNDTTNTDKFKVHARVLYTYRIAFKDYPKSEAERNSKGIEIETSGDL